MSEAPLQFGKYRLSRLLARGGMGEVYLARLVGELGFEKRLVIKTILPELAAKKRFIELFAAEAKTAVALSHGNIVPTYELGRSDNTFYIVMGYVDGPSVAQMLAACRHAGRTPDIGVAMHVIRGVLAGLAYAHHEEPGRPAVVHRDITPRNILLDRSGQVRIVDFGIAAPAKAESGVRAGSTGFVAPEQVRGDVPDPRADVFSAAALLYELCTFERAFPKRGVWLTPDLDALPELLRAPVAAGLAFEPDDRPRDAAALLTLLRPAILEYAGSFDDQQLAAYLRELFPDGWSPNVPRESGVHPIRGFEGDNQTFATRLTSVTGMHSQETQAIPETEDDRPARSAARLEPSRDRDAAGRRVPFAPLLLGVAAIGGLVLAFGGKDGVGPTGPEGRVEPTGRVEPEAPAPSEIAVGAKADAREAPELTANAEPEPTESRQPEPELEDPAPAIEPPPAEPLLHRLTVDPPDAELLVDGVPVEGASPHALELAPDRAVVIELRRAGYAPHRLELDPSATPPANIVLTKHKPREPGFLKVTAPGVPWAEVRIDGKKVGTTPTRKLQVPSGRHRVEVVCIPDVCGERQTLLSKTVTIEPNQLHTIKSGR